MSQRNLVWERKQAKGVINEYLACDMLPELLENEVIGHLERGEYIRAFEAITYRSGQESD